MDKAMFKTLTFLKRKPGLSFEAFRDYYENHHSKLGEQLLTRAKLYMRRYVTPLDQENGSEGQFDVITEVWFADREDYELQMAELSKPEIIALVAEDEGKLFDNRFRSLVCVDELTSNL